MWSGFGGLLLLTSIPIVSAAKKSADYELSYEHKFINVAEGYSCYESFIEDMVYLITEQPTSRSSLPRFVSLLRSINRPTSYHRTREHESMPYCRPPMPLQSEDFVVLVKLIRLHVPKESIDKYLSALRREIRLNPNCEAMCKSINMNDIFGLLHHVNSVIDVVNLLHLMHTCGKQKVELKLQVEDKLSKLMPSIEAYFTEYELDTMSSFRRMRLSNRPLLPSLDNGSSLVFNGVAVSGRYPSPSHSPNSSLQTSLSSTADVSMASSPDNDFNSPSFFMSIMDKRLSYMRHSIGSYLVSIGALTNRTLLFSELLNMHAQGAESQLSIWNSANQQRSPDNPALLAYLQPDRVLTVFASGSNTACWLIRDYEIVDCLFSQHASWSIQPNDLFVGITGFNNIKSFDPLKVVSDESDFEHLRDYLKFLFNEESQYSAAFVGQFLES